MKILSWTPIPMMNGVTFYRQMLPLIEMQRRGHEVQLIMGDQISPSVDAHFDVIQVSRAQDPFSHLLISGWRKSGNVKIVQDIDDDLWHVGDHNPAYAWCSDPGNQRRLAETIQMSDVVTTTQPWLAQMIQDRATARAVEVVPNAIPTSALGPAITRPLDHVIVGWAGGGSHARDLEYSKWGINEALANTPSGTEFHTIGFPITDMPYTGSVRHTKTAYMPAWDYLYSYNFHIALAPLDPRDPFNMGKSDLRWLEAAAKKAAVIATNWGPYKGLVALPVEDHRADWGRHLHTLMSSEQAYIDLTEAAYQVATQRTTEAIGGLWEQAFTP